MVDLRQPCKNKVTIWARAKYRSELRTNPNIRPKSPETRKKAARGSLFQSDIIRMRAQLCLIKNTAPPIYSDLLQSIATKFSSLTATAAAATMRQKPFTLCSFSQQFPLTTTSFAFFTSPLFRWLFIEVAQFHFTKNAFALHLLFQSA